MKTATLVCLTSSLLLLLLVSCTGASRDSWEDEGSEEANSPVSTLEKRYAMLSYFRPRSSRFARLSYFRQPSNSRGHYGGWGRSSYRYRPRMPWDYLPDSNCFRQRCRSTYDCCQRYSLCDPNGKVCYDCWYGHPCRTNKDCCKRFPHCNTALKSCTD